MLETVFHLNHRGVIALKGADRHALLQGLITNDIKHLKDSGILFAALLSPQGRFLHDFFVIEKGDTLYLTPEKERLKDLLSKLTMYKLRSKVILEDMSDHLHVMSSLDQDLPSPWLKDPRLKDMGSAALMEDLPSSLTPLETYHTHRMKLGVPDGSLDLNVDKAIILENNYNELNALDWDKGCYLGQELMSRTFHRGLIRKRLLPVKIEGNITKNETLFLRGKKIGVMKSSLADQGLALLQLELAQESIETNTPIETESGTKAFPSLPSFL